MGEKSAKANGGKPKVVEDWSKSGDESKTGIKTSSDHPWEGALESSESDEAPERPKSPTGAQSPQWKGPCGGLKIIRRLWNTDRSRPFTHPPHALLGEYRNREDVKNICFNVFLGAFVTHCCRIFSDNLVITRKWANLINFSNKNLCQNIIWKLAHPHLVLHAKLSSACLGAMFCCLN